MDNAQRDLYYKGYVTGYRAGIRDGAEGKTLESIEEEVANLPIEALELSARAYNCLTLAGCVYIADVLSLDAHTIGTMRNLGPKTASEIACSLDRRGICCSVWCDYL